MEFISFGYFCIPMLNKDLDKLIKINKNVYLGSKDISNKLIIFGSNRKNWNAAVWQKKVMLEKNQGLRHREGGGDESRHSFAK